MMSHGGASRMVWLAASLALMAVVVVVLRAVAPALLQRLLARARSQAVLTVVSVFVLAALAAVMAVSLIYPGYLDHAEPSFVGVSWLVRNGKPLYHAFDSSDRYTLLYGPACYLPYVVSMWIGGGSVHGPKVVVLLADLGMFCLLFSTMRTLFDRKKSLIAIAITALFSLTIQRNDYLFQIRGDVLIVFATVLGLYGATRRTGVGGAIALAVGSAFVLDAKVTAFVYVLPLFVLISQVRGWRTAMLAGTGAVALAALPFLLPNVSLSGYVFWLRHATGHPTSVRDLLTTIKALPLLFLPLPLIAGLTPWRDERFVAYARTAAPRWMALLPCMALAIAASSRIGGGPHHLLPFAPLLGYEFARLYKEVADERSTESWLYGVVWCCSAVVVLLRVATGFASTLPVRGFYWNWVGDVTADIRTTVERYKGHLVQMGYGEVTEAVTYYRPEVVFATGRLLLDSQALNDMDVDGIPIPDSTIGMLRACLADVWLIPKGEKPFAVANVFSEGQPDVVKPHPLFSASFRDAFAEHFRKTGMTKYFDVWTCDGSVTAAK